MKSFPNVAPKRQRKRKTSATVEKKVAESAECTNDNGNLSANDNLKPQQGCDNDCDVQSSSSR